MANERLRIGAGRPRMRYPSRAEDGKDDMLGLLRGSVGQLGPRLEYLLPRARLELCQTTYSTEGHLRRGNTDLIPVAESVLVGEPERLPPGRHANRRGVFMLRRAAGVRVQDETVVGARQ
jgi:hypothetical protein